MPFGELNLKDKIISQEQTVIWQVALSHTLDIHIMSDGEQLYL